ncbi:putative Gcn5-related n-acetyltransferase [Hyella patelloides LEGE 07179]|uniref:Putative Gcn5-related n-acetyltransferase n=1 Tax=Hyella patelloides LEGE 07179 TaxID=945734 RepID=A0A563W000_9CYAN|nr:GNAT family N-acetyltransferase [Hyella patelloides]VEP16965.1 putative Gcn5-related n-acetyltransferase [Hyella patelloides LEGE 07179]
MMPPTLETSRLILRKLEISDLTAVFDYSSEPEYTQFLPYPCPTSIADFKSIFQNLLDNEDSYIWAICLKGKHQLIGIIEISLDSPTEANLHYEINHQFYNQGFATEATQTVITWTWENLPQIAQIIADTHSANLGSQRVMEKSGMNRIKTEFVTWDKYPEPVELVYYQIKRPIS